MTTLLYLAILAYTGLLRHVLGSNAPTSFTLAVNGPENIDTTSACIILSQLTVSDPPLIQAMKPICYNQAKNTDDTDSSPGEQVNWPLASDMATGNGISSPLVIFAQIESTDALGGESRATAGCAMYLNPGQVWYMLGRTMKWDGGVEQLWDVTAGDFLSNWNGKTSTELKCRNNATLLPDGFSLPDPSYYNAENKLWSTPVPIISQKLTEQTTSAQPSSESTGSTSKPSSINWDTVSSFSLIPPPDSATSSTSNDGSDASSTRTRTSLVTVTASTETPAGSTSIESSQKASETGGAFAADPVPPTQKISSAVGVPAPNPNIITITMHEVSTKTVTVTAGAKSRM